MLFFMFIEHSVYHPFLLLSLLPNFQKRDGGAGSLTGSSFLEEGCWERGGDFFQGGLQFFNKK